MKKTFIITESQYVNLEFSLKESKVIYDDEDYIEVFIDKFKDWVKSKNYQNLPMSFLVKKHLDDFTKDLNLEYNVSDNSWRGALSNMKQVGKIIVDKGLSTIPTLRPTEKFTEKFKKPLDFFVKEMEIPSHVNLRISEPSPYNLKLGIDIDWEELLRNPPYNKNINSITRKLLEKIENFLGISSGNPEHGEIEIEAESRPNFIGLENWKKNILDKNIKRQIKTNIPESKNIQRIVFKPDDYNFRATLDIIFKGYPNWDTRKKIRKGVEDILMDMGYNEETLRVKIS